MVIFSVHLR